MMSIIEGDEQLSYGTCQVTKEKKRGGDEPSLTRRVFPTGFKAEIKELIWLAWPIGLGSFLSYFSSAVAIMFCGHLGRIELDAAALATSTINCTGLFVCTGMTLACDTVFSQAYGSDNLKLLSIHFQRSLIIMTLLCLVCWSVHLNAELLLNLLHQDPLVSRLAGDYILCFMPGLLFNFIFQVLVKFLQNQNIVIPVLILAVVGNVFNVLAHYILVNVCLLRTRGSAISQALTWLLMCLATIVYTLWSGILKKSWTGWSREALQDWGYFTKLALAGLVMTTAEWCTFEGSLFLAGTLGVAEQGALSICFKLDWILYMQSLGLSVACSIRVGQNLGAGNSDGAKTSYRVAQVTLLFLSSLSVIVILSLRNVIALVFTTDRVVVNMVSSIILIMVFEVITDAAIGICGGALRGCGQQWKGGLLNFIGYCCIAIPAIILYIFFTNIGVRGIWLGLLTGAAPISVVYVILAARIDWVEEAIKAVKRNRNGEKSKNSHERDDSNQQKEENIKDLIGQKLRDKEGPEKNPFTENTKDGTLDLMLLFKRLAVCFMVLVIFLAGLCIRVFVQK